MHTSRPLMRERRRHREEDRLDHARGGATIVICTPLRLAEAFVAARQLYGCDSQT